MYRKEVNARSPMRLLDQTIHGGLGPGNLGVVLARAGVGKTAFLVQLGLDDLLRERPVLHVSLDSTIERVRNWYDELFADLCRYTSLDDPGAAGVLLERHRMIQVYTAEDFSSGKLQSVVDVLREHAGFAPAAILVDGLDLASIAKEDLVGLKALAASSNAELWVSVLTHRAGSEPGDSGLPAPADRFDDLIDVAVLMQPRGENVGLKLLRDHEAEELVATTLELEPVNLRLSDSSVEKVAQFSGLHPQDCTLYSGAASGTEACFGRWAEHWGVREVNYTFPSHQPARQRGLVQLSERELRQGDVSLSYVSRRMARNYTSSQFLRRVLQTIWHQVNRSKQIFAVGTIQEDGTIKGGTGWGAELARVWSKPLWVYDQERSAWFHWDVATSEWVASSTPTITSADFCGTGTRFLTEEGEKAIESLFASSFSAS